MQGKVYREMNTEGNELASMLKQMEKIPGAKIKVSVDENNQLIGIFFQDERMARIFEKYPEVVIFDATYRLNNRRMPLFIMLAIDGLVKVKSFVIG